MENLVMNGRWGMFFAGFFAMGLDNIRTVSKGGFAANKEWTCKLPPQMVSRQIPWVQVF